ncbi:type VI secretion system Vgr family protein [Variovorax sp. dw_308]|uniref:type VI secretion system Vgr family protein n=1 Tax=Variovorax sp. dw_308 TaxID=2721546 RepID=UPI001C48C665
MATAPRSASTPPAGPADEDAIESWAPTRDSIATEYSAISFNFKNPRPVLATTITHNQPGDMPRLEVHEYAGAYGLRATGGSDYVNLRTDELDAVAKYHAAESNNYQVQPGRWFQLIEHFSVKSRTDNDSKYLIVSATHTASNNYLQEIGKPAEYSNSFIASRRYVYWRPGRGHNSTRVQVLAPQTATVVGPEGAGSLHVDEYGRIRIQYHWDREGRHSAWVRVSSSWAGGETGMVSHPRVGSEVVVMHLDGCPDHPLVTGVVYNAWRMPPWELPQQKALTGLRSRELAGQGGNSPMGRSNHLLLDDTEGKIQAQIRSDHDASQLSLGHITRIERNVGRQDPRGQGFELRTDGHGAVRAAEGMLLTTEPRANANAHITDMSETVARLTAGRDQHESLSDTAHQAKAHQTGDQDEVTKELKAQNDSIKGSHGNRAQGEFPELTEPHLVLASPSGIQATTAGSIHLASKEHHAITSGAHTSVSAGKSLLVSVKEAVRMFAYKSGMKLVAASSDIDITALKDSINLLAKLNITHTANKITITAKEEVVINGGTSYTKWNASGIESGTNGIWREHAAVHSLVGPANLPVKEPEFPDVSTTSTKPRRMVDFSG